MTESLLVTMFVVYLPLSEVVATVDCPDRGGFSTLDHRNKLRRSRLGIASLDESVVNLSSVDLTSGPVVAMKSKGIGCFKCPHEIKRQTCGDDLN